MQPIFYFIIEVKEMGKIYKISNTINDKVYIGKTLLTIEQRFSQHCKDSKRNHTNRPLYNAMNKYGVENFKVELVEECDDNILSEREIYWIEYYHSCSNGYNATLGGDGATHIKSEEVLSLWEEGKSVKEIANIINCDNGWIGVILKNNGITSAEIKKRQNVKSGYKTEMLDKDTEEVLKVFNSTHDAAKYLIEVYNLNPSSEHGYSSHIGEVCRGKRKTCMGYKWKYQI